MTDALPSSVAAAITGFSDTVYAGLSLPAPLPGAPGCDLLASPELIDIAATSSVGTAMRSYLLPPSMVYAGLQLFHQWVVYDPTNALGFVVSGGGKALLGN